MLSVIFNVRLPFVLFIILKIYFSSFTDLALSDMLSANVRDAGYSKPTPVQQYAIPLILQGYDIMACAQTGSGLFFRFLILNVRTEKKSLTCSTY